MHIGSCVLHSCIRAHKQAWTLASMGHDIHFCTSWTNHHSTTGYASLHQWEWEGPNGIDVRQLANEIRILDATVDLWHVHNEPNWIFRVVKEVSKKPIIFDIHDWTSLRKVTEPQEFEIKEEEYALKHADGFCVPSKGYLNRIRAISNKPSALVYSMVPSFFFPPKCPEEERLPGLVYSGGTKGKNKDFIYNYDYRDWSKFAQVVAKTHKMYFYTANGGEDYSEYTNPNVELFNPLNFPDLIRHLSRHSAGLVGASVPLLDFQDSMPNKLWEYLSAGIPAIVVNAPEAQRFVETNSLGVGIRDASEAGEALAALTKHNVLMDRWHYTMETQMPSLLGLYEEVLCSRRPRAIPQAVS